MKKLARPLGRLVLALNLALVLGLLLAYLSRYVSPESHAWLALAGLAYPVWVIGNVLFVLFWGLSKRRKRTLFSLGALVLGFGVHMRFFNPTGSPTEHTEDPALTVATYNVKLFDVYHAQNNAGLKDSIMQVLGNAHADVVCLQEYYRTDRTQVFSTRSDLEVLLESPYVVESTVKDRTGLQHFGVALFSKYPILEHGEVNLISDRINRCIYADIQTPSDTVRVYSAHLASIRFQKEDYDFVSGREEEFWKGGKRLSTRLMDAYQRRAEQVKAIREHVASSPHPTVVCGDFNDTPVSFAYREMEQEMTDSFREANRGLGRTYVGTFPSFRIDYIWHSDDLCASRCEVLPGDFSDHRAVRATLYPAGD